MCMFQLQGHIPAIAKSHNSHTHVLSIITTRSALLLLAHAKLFICTYMPHIATQIFVYYNVCTARAQHIYKYATVQM
mgnify:CR=1 FL=1